MLSQSNNVSLQVKEDFIVLSVVCTTSDYVRDKERDDTQGVIIEILESDFTVELEIANAVLVDIESNSYE